MALSVCEEIHSRFAGLLQPAFIMIQRATSSPSRPASVAMTRSLTSPRFISPVTTLYWREVSGITTSFIFSGSMGRSSMLHFSSFLS